MALRRCAQAGEQAGECRLEARVLHAGRREYQALAGQGRIGRAVDQQAAEAGLRAEQYFADGGEGLVVIHRRESLQQDAQQAVAADAEAEQFVGFVAQVVGDAGGDAGGHHLPCMFSQVAFEAAAADQSLVVARFG